VGKAGRGGGSMDCTVRADGSRIGELKFLPIERRSCPEEKWDGLQRTSEKLANTQLWERVCECHYGETRIGGPVLERLVGSP